MKEMMMSKQKINKHKYYQRWMLRRMRWKGWKRKRKWKWRRKKNKKVI
jgi:hypothetical protein